MFIIGFVCYFLIVGLISLASYLHGKQQRDAHYSEAILGGRSINYFLTALSAQASDMSDWLFMAFPAAIFIGGMPNAWIAIGLIFGMFLTWHFLARPLRKQTEKFNTFTLSSYFEKRFNDTTNILRFLSAILSLLFFSVYIAAGLKGFGFLAESIFDIPYVFGTLIAILCTVSYIFLGGYKALAWIDCFQAIFLLTVIFLVPLLALHYIGGFNEIIKSATEQNISLSLIPDDMYTLLNILLMSFSWSMGYFGTPHILTKFMGINDEKEVKKAKYVGMTWQISVLSAAGLIGLIAIAFFPEGLANRELVFVEMVKILFNPLAAGFVLSAVAGATVSVMTAQMLVVVSIISEDFYNNLIKPQATEKELLLVYRFSIIIISALSFLVSLDKQSSIQSLVQYAWIGFGSSFGPLVWLSLYSKKINTFGAIASMIMGSLVAILWQKYLQYSIFLHYGLDIPAVIPGFILSILCAYLVSYVTDNNRQS